MGIWMAQWGIGMLYGVVLGAALASFACVVSERVPAGRGINGRSACACGRQLRLHENVPVVGWLSTGGRARCCGAKLPARYVLWEAAYGLWGALVLGWAWHRWTEGALTAVSGTAAAVAFLAFFGVVLVATWQRPNR
jgi:prepilin signal peptidase PulO-like enzyme (type II secretory pathway)